MLPAWLCKAGSTQSSTHRNPQKSPAPVYITWPQYVILTPTMKLFPGYLIMIWVSGWDRASKFQLKFFCIIPTPAPLHQAENGSFRGTIGVFFVRLLRNFTHM